MFQQVYQGTTLKGYWVIRKSGGRVSVTTNTASGILPIILVGTTPVVVRSSFLPSYFTILFLTALIAMSIIDKQGFRRNITRERAANNRGYAG